MQLIPPHAVVSREVVETDLPRVLEHGLRMYDMCFEESGIHKDGAMAIAHSQVTRLDPLCFFVARDGDVYLNPKITRHTSVRIRRAEGCMSLPEGRARTTWRWNKCEVTYNLLAISPEGTLSIGEQKSEKLSGIRAIMFQHEVDHMDGLYILGRVAEEPTLENL